MANSTSIYYPFIEVRDTAWLRSACLYWDTLQTIVPNSIDSPYHHRDCILLEDEGVLQPYFVSSELPVVRDISSDFIKYLNTEEAKSVLYGGSRRPTYVHADKLSPAVQRLTQIHPEKLPYEVQDLLEDSTRHHRGTDDWLEMDESLANYYMTLLASRISDRISAGVVTDLNNADGLNLVVKAGATLPNPSGFNRDARRWQRHENAEYDAPHQLAEGALATLALEGISIDPETPIPKLLKFRKDYSSELGRFRAAVSNLASEIDEDLPIEAMRQRVWDIYQNELSPSLNDLKSTMDGARIGWVSKSILKISFLSAGSTSMLVTAGLAVPQALLAAAGISLVATGLMYNEDRKQNIRRNPYSYLLKAESTFQS